MLAALVRWVDRSSLPRRRAPQATPPRRRGRRLVLVAAVNLVLGACAATSVLGLGLLATVLLCEACVQEVETRLTSLWRAPDEAAAALEDAYLLRDFPRARRLGLEFLGRTEVPQRLDRLDPAYRRVIDSLFDLGERTRDLPLLGAVAGRAVRFDPNDAFAWYFRGRSALADGDHAAAETALRQAFALRPYANQLALALSGLYATTGRAREAARTLEREAETVDRMLDMPEWRHFVVVGLGDRGSASHVLPFEACRPQRKTVSFPLEVRGADVGFAAMSMLSVRLSVSTPTRDGVRPAAVATAHHLVDGQAGGRLTWIGQDALLTERPVIRFRLPEPAPAGTPVTLSFEICRSPLLRSRLPAPSAPGAVRIVAGAGANG